MSSRISQLDPAGFALAVRTRLAYGIGQSAEGLQNGVYAALLFFFFYNQVLGLSSSLVGIALFIALAFDAITDPLVGSISDNWRSRFGRRHPFMLVAILPLALSFFMLLSSPSGLSQMQLFSWLVVSSVLTRGAMTLHFVPHLSLGAELSTNFNERTTIVSYRYFSSFLGIVITIALAFGVFFTDTEAYPKGQFNVEAYSPFGATLAALMVVAILITVVGT